MGTGKKEAARRERQGKNAGGMGNVRAKGENFYRTAKKAKALNVLKEGKPQRNSDGMITKAASFQSRELPKARVEPNRKWFTNTRVIAQDTLEAFRAAVAERTADPNQVLLKTNKLPMSLIREPVGKNGLKQHRAKIAVESAPFADTFGPKAQRKRVKLDAGSLADLADESVKMHENYLEKLEEERLLSGNAGPEGQRGEAEEEEQAAIVAKEWIFGAGKSKRIWNELYKVIDSSDVVIQVLDARDPIGTRCRSVEKYIREEAPHKHLIFILNKVDLVPTKVAATWVRLLSKDHPTLAFHASLKNAFGKGSLISLLRQFSALHKERKQISVGMIGYPNTGKSSIINTLRAKKVCNVAPIPGETKVWQYVTLMKRIYLIDCPGVVPPNQNDSDQDILLRGVVRIENVQNPGQYVHAALERVKRQHVERTYDITAFNTTGEFLELLARKSGRLLKGGEPDIDGVAKMVINDFLRGKIPWFTPPPPLEGEEASRVEGREGRLGEMGRVAGIERVDKKRKRDEAESVAAEGDVADAFASSEEITPPTVDEETHAESDLDESNRSDEGEDGDSESVLLELEDEELENKKLGGDVDVSVFDGKSGSGDDNLEEGIGDIEDSG